MEITPELHVPQPSIQQHEQIQQYEQPKPEPETVTLAEVQLPTPPPPPPPLSSPPKAQHNKKVEGNGKTAFSILYEMRRNADHSYNYWKWSMLVLFGILLTDGMTWFYLYDNGLQVESTIAVIGVVLLFLSMVWALVVMFVYKRRVEEIDAFFIESEYNEHNNKN